MRAVAIALILVAAALGVSRKLGLKLENELVVSAIRALAQLLAVAAVIEVVFASLGLSGLFLLVMIVAASLTAGRRLADVRRGALLAFVAITGAALLAMTVLFGLGVFELAPRFLIPIGGMLIGNSMTAVSVAGARLSDEVKDKTREIEARLALGVPASEALRPYLRRSAVTALVPTIDSTKNVGLIFLPGAFVGMMLGGASPLRAAQVQLVVLFMLLGAVAIAAMAATLLVGRSFIGVGERISIPAPATPKAAPGDSRRV